MVIIEKFSYTFPAPEDLLNHISFQSINRKILSGTPTMHRILTSYRKPTFTWFISENFEGFSLPEKMNGNPLPPSQVKQYFYIFAQTLNILHNHSLSLNDWRPDNFLFTDTFFKFMNYSVLRPISIVSNEEKLYFLGDPRWMAPEALIHKQYDLIHADIWCLGLYLHFMLTGKMLFSSSDEIYKNYKKFKYVVPDGIDQHPADILSKTLLIDPTKRISLREILSHRYFIPSVPFPVLHINLQRTPELIEWMDYFNIDIQTVFDKSRSLIVDDDTMIMNLCLMCIAKGRKPNDFKRSLKIEIKSQKDHPLSDIILPQQLTYKEPENRNVTGKVQSKKIQRTKTDDDIIKPSTKDKTDSLHKLLDVCSLELFKRNARFNHLDAYTENEMFGGKNG